MKTLTTLTNPLKRTCSSLVKVQNSQNIVFLVPNLACVLTMLKWWNLWFFVCLLSYWGNLKTLTPGPRTPTPTVLSVRPGSRRSSGGYSLANRWLYFLKFPLEEKGPWGLFYQLRRVLAKGRHLLQILLKALPHYGPGQWTTPTDPSTDHPPN